MDSGAALGSHLLTKLIKQAISKEARSCSSFLNEGRVGASHITLHLTMLSFMDCGVQLRRLEMPVLPPCDHQHDASKVRQFLRQR